MAEKWTCHVCETTCDGEICPVCGAVRTNRVLDTPPKPVPPPSFVVPGGDDEPSEREILLQEIKRNASLFYILFLALDIPAAWGALRDLTYAGDWAGGPWDWLMALTPVLLFIFCTISCIRTKNCGENAVKSALRMLLFTLFDGIAYLLFVTVNFGVVFDPTFELFVPLAILTCLLLHGQAKRLQKL